MIYLAEMEECVWCEKEPGWFGTRKPQNVSCNHCDRFIHYECLINIGKPMSSQEYVLLLKSHEGFEYTCDDCVPTNGKLIFILNLLYEVQYYYFSSFNRWKCPPCLERQCRSSSSTWAKDCQGVSSFLSRGTWSPTYETTSSVPKDIERGKGAV